MQRLSRRPDSGLEGASRHANASLEATVPLSRGHHCGRTQRYEDATLSRRGFVVYIFFVIIIIVYYEFIFYLFLLSPYSLFSSQADLTQSDKLSRKKHWDFWWQRIGRSMFAKKFEELLLSLLLSVVVAVAVSVAVVVVGVVVVVAAAAVVVAAAAAAVVVVDDVDVVDDVVVVIVVFTIVLFVVFLFCYGNFIF
jgi:hypothetical protein